MLPFVYTPLYAREMFADNERKNFFSLCLSIFAFRMFHGAVDPATKEFGVAQFTALNTKSFPERL